MTSSSSSWCFLRCFPLLHYIFLGVQMSLERERCADVLINLPLLTSVTKLLTLSKLLCRSEILWNIQSNWSKRVQMLFSLWLLIGNGYVSSWKTPACLIFPLHFGILFWEASEKVYFSAVWGSSISRGWMWEIPQISVPGTYPLEISWYCAKIVQPGCHPIKTDWSY